MYVLEERNISEAIPTFCRLVLKEGRKSGDILRMDGPVSIKLSQPRERVIFHREIGTSPFYFFGIAMQALRDNIEDLRKLGFSMRSDSSGTPYIMRAESSFVTVQKIDPLLDLTVTSIASDPMQDAVVLSVVQEFMAHSAGGDMGSLYWTSSNVHIDMAKVGEYAEKMADKVGERSPYTKGEVAPHRLIEIPLKRWTREFDTFMKLGHRGSYVDPFFSDVAVPFHQASVSFKEKLFGPAMDQMNACLATDWQRIGQSFITSKSLEIID